MSILDTEKKHQEDVKNATKLKPEDYGKLYQISDYTMTDKEKEVRSMIIRHFVLGDVTMQKPRVEFNDLSVLGRAQIDRMAFNTYQPNNGETLDGDEMNAWKSKAMRPVVRNKCISIAAHATARLIFPKVFAYDNDSNVQQEAATIMEDLMEWSADQSNYADHALYRTITALSDPASIGYSEYCETFRTVKRQQEDGTYKEERILDEDLSGFQQTVVPVEELYIENFFEPDIQKQGWLIWRRVQSYSLLERKYKDKYNNWKFVYPGVQLVYNDANQSFYQLYDTNMRQDDAEEIIYWNKPLDLMVIMVNGVMLTSYDNPNPREDKQYPFDKFGYEIINNKCFYYKSLAFKMMHDANIINTLYPMIIDGTYLNLMPPMVNVGGETIGADVIVPGMVTTLSDPNADLRAIQLSTNLKAGIDTLFKVDESINESSQEPLQQGQNAPGSQTAFEISRIENNANTVLGLFIKMIASHVKQFGKLRKGDILQYLTIADVDKITDKPELVYKTFLLRDKQSQGKSTNRKIQFDASLNENPMASKYGLPPEQESLAKSFDTLAQEDKTSVEIYRADPQLFRDLKFMIQVSPDVLNPRSEDLENAYKLEAYDRAIQNPLVDQEKITRDLLLSANPITKKNPDKYIKVQQPQDQMSQIQQMMQGGQGGPGTMGQQPMPGQASPPKISQVNSGNSPLNAIAKSKATQPAGVNLQ